MMGKIPQSALQPAKKTRWWKVLAVGGAALMILAMATAALGLWVQSQAAAQDNAAARTPEVELLYAACVNDMVSKTCKVMGTQSADAATQPPRHGEMVFVAGVGAIAAEDYAQMYAAGDAMCSVVRGACTKDWNSGQCKTARKLLLPAVL